MNIIPKPIRTEAFTCYADKPVEVLKTEMRQLFATTNLTIMGHFTHGTTFEITPQWQLVRIAAGGKVAYLNGQISQHKPNKAKVTFTISPNPVLPLSFFIFLLLELLYVLKYMSGNQNDLWKGSLFILFFALGTLVYTSFAKSSLKQNVMNAFDLKEELADNQA